VTTAVCREVDEADPPEFEALTATRIVELASPETRVYEEPVAPETPAQLAPELLQRCHWYV